MMDAEYCDSVDTSTEMDAIDSEVSDDVLSDLPDDIPEDVPDDALGNKVDRIDSDVTIQEDIETSENELLIEQDAEADSICEDAEDEETYSVDDTDLIKDLVDQNVTKAHLPRNGEWSDPSAEGNSDFIISDDALIKWGNDKKHQCTGAELKQWMRETFDSDSVRYNHKEPDFSPFIDSDIGRITLERMPTKRNGGSYSQANEKAMSKLGFKSSTEVQEYMKQKGLTWHECADGHTVIAIPTRINAAFKHSGGISIERSLESMRETISLQTGGASLALQRDALEGVTEGLGQAIDAQHKNFRETKTILFSK